MTKLFLASSLSKTAGHIAKQLNDTTNTKIAFVITASENETKDLAWRDADRNALIQLGFNVADYTFTGKSASQIEHELDQFDIVCIEGGDTFYLLEIIQKTDCADVLRRLIEKGKPYIGSSAGSIIAGPTIYPLRHSNDDQFPNLKNFDGLQLVDFIILPHWGTSLRQELYRGNRLEFNYDENYKRIILTDNQYVSIKDNCMKLIDVVHDHKE